MGLIIPPLLVIRSAQRNQTLLGLDPLAFKPPLVRDAALQV